jgi:Effector Associated Constant Component 1
METELISISFPNGSVAEGNRFASSLMDTLRDVSSDITLSRHRERAEAQDFGSTLSLILGTAAVTAVAKGIAAWLARNSGATIEIRRQGAVVLVATHLDSKDVSRIVQALSP